MQANDPRVVRSDIKGRQEFVWRQNCSTHRRLIPYLVSDVSQKETIYNLDTFISYFITYKAGEWIKLVSDKQAVDDLHVDNIMI